MKQANIVLFCECTNETKTETETETESKRENKTNIGH